MTQIKNSEMGWSSGVVSYEKTNGTLPEYTLWNMRDFVAKNEDLFKSDKDLIRIYTLTLTNTTPIGFYGALSVIHNGHKRVLELMDEEDEGEEDTDFLFYNNKKMQFMKDMGWYDLGRVDPSPWKD